MDLETGAVVAVTAQGAEVGGPPDDGPERCGMAQEEVKAVGSGAEVRRKWWRTRDTTATRIAFWS